MLRLILPALLPSWRFFDRIGPSPRIEFALMARPHEPATGWREVRPRPASVPALAMLRALVWNPRGNESLYLVSCAERLLEFPSQRRAAQLLDAVGDALHADGIAAVPPAAFMRVRIVVVDREPGQLSRQVAFVSEVHPLDAARASSSV